MMIQYKFILRQAGLHKNYKYIILAPEMLHRATASLYVEERKRLKDVEHVVNKVKLNKDDYLIKYRDKSQFLAFPTSHASEIGYGTLMNYCDENSIVIGFPGSAMIECLMNNISFYSYFDYEKFSHKSTVNLLLLKCLFIAKNKEELLENILCNNILKPGYKKEDLLFNDGKYLNEIVASILKIKA